MGCCAAEEGGVGSGGRARVDEDALDAVDELSGERDDDEADAERWSRDR